MEPWLIWLAFVAGAYVVGSIPFGLLLARSRGVDIRSEGSGNIGATNVGRVLGRRLGIFCFVLDVAKGAVPVLAYGFWSGAITGEPFVGEAGG
ncbi:MAG: glycerol-3-phosphate acyltransferase, partial [Phycisphaeraceae bacterium]